MLTLHSNLSDTELDNKIKELEDDKISLNLTYLATHNLNGDRKYERSTPAIDNLSLASSIKLEDLDEDLQDYYKEFFRASNEKIKDELKESKETDILKARSIIADQIRGEWDADKGYTKAAADLAELKDIDTKEAQDLMLDIASEEHVHVGELETAYDAFDPHLFDELEDGHNEADENAEPANALDYDITEEPIADSLDIEEDYKKGIKNNTSYDEEWQKILDQYGVEDEDECAWCHEKFPKSELVFDKDFGPLCHQCIQAIKSHEGEDSLKFEEALKESIESDQIEKIEDYIERVYEMRKEGIAESEYSIKNLVFKELRNKGYLDDLRELKFKLKSKDLSLESLEEAEHEVPSDKILDACAECVKIAEEESQQ